MEYIQSKVLWHLLDNTSTGGEEEERLIDQFCRLLVQLHELDWKQFNADLPENDPLFFIDRWLDEARGALQNFPDIDASPFMDWVAKRRDLFACAHPSPVHQDFHPANILVKADGSATVIDWTGFNVTDPRFDLAWTLLLAHAHGRPGWRDQILQGYQRHAGKSAEHIEVFEAVACARRLFDVTVSLTHGAQKLGMNEQAIESIRAYMDAHKRVHRLFIKRTGLQIEAFDNLFGKSG
jgi:aminoglycoside phosphotransferase (APT) family kinase protein